MVARFRELTTDVAARPGLGRRGIEVTDEHGHGGARREGGRKKKKKKGVVVGALGLGRSSGVLGPR